MNNEKVIAFPHLGDYSYPITFLVNNLCDATILDTPPITKRTIELGSKYSPDFVCIPFKYNMGNFIEALEGGANVLIQAGGGCRYGYYAEVQEKILKDLGYKFDFCTLTDGDSLTPITLYKKFKSINEKLSFTKFAYYTLLTLLMINYMDNVDDYIRLNIGFEVNKGDFLKLKDKMLNDFIETKSFIKLFRKYLKYKKKFKNIKINKPTKRLKIGIIGELYTSMEPFASYDLEAELANMNIEVKRFTNVTYLLVKKARESKKMLRYIRKYVKHKIGADGLDNVYRAKKLIDEGYDGLIHIKPFGCSPEIGAIPIIDKVCKDNNMPIIYLSFDNQTSRENIKTKLEAFYDMISLK